MHLLDHSLELTRTYETVNRIVYGGIADPEFKNLIGPFGGWTAGLLAKAILQSASAGMELVSITTDFLEGVPSGPIEIETVCDRYGKSTEFWSAKITCQNGEIIGARANAVVSRRRDTVEWTDRTMPQAPDPDTCSRFTLPMPWTKTIEIRPAVNPPFQQPNQKMQSSAWVRIDPDRSCDAVSIVCLSDTPAPRVFFKTGQPSMLATISMTVYLHATTEDLAEVGADYMLLEADAERGGRGFYDQHARLWGRAGKLLATTQQMVWYKATDIANEAKDTR